MIVYVMYMIMQHEAMQIFWPYLSSCIVQPLYHPDRDKQFLCWRPLPGNHELQLVHQIQRRWGSA